MQFSMQFSMQFLMPIVWQIAQRDYKFGKGKHKSLTKATYDAVGNHFRGLWGKEAGWAHSVLFTADLKAFSERLTTKAETKEEETNRGEKHGEDAVVESDVVTSGGVKRDCEEKTVAELDNHTSRKAKRRRKT
jgi:N-glycosylase/DNA lyase